MASTYKDNKPPNEMLGLLEGQIQTWDGMGEVWCGHIIEGIRTTLKARIEKEGGKPVERTKGYSNNEDALRQEFGMHPGVDGSEAAGILEEAGRGNGRCRLQWDTWANLRVLDNVALLGEQADASSQVEETALEEGNAPISILGS